MLLEQGCDYLPYTSHVACGKIFTINITRTFAWNLTLM